jgi:hypothetical protein
MLSAPQERENKAWGGASAQPQAAPGSQASPERATGKYIADFDDRLCRPFWADEI